MANGNPWAGASNLPGYTPPDPSVTGGSYWDRVGQGFKNYFGNTSAAQQVAGSPISLSNDSSGYIDPQNEIDLLRAQARQRQAVALGLVGSLANAPRGQMIGSGPYQHYVADYGAPIRNVAAYMAARDVLGQTQPEERQIFGQGQQALGQYAQQAAQRYQQSVQNAQRQRLQDWAYYRRTGRLPYQDIPVPGQTDVSD